MADVPTVAVLDRLPAAVIVSDEQRRICRWTRAAAALYGYGSDEAIGQQQAELLATIAADGEEAVTQSLSDQGQWSGLVLQRHQDGRRLLLLSQQRLDRDPGGRAWAVYETVTPLSPEAELDALVPRYDRREQSAISAFVRDPEGQIIGLRPLWVSAEMAQARPRYAEQLGLSSTEWYPRLLDSELGRAMVEAGERGLAIDFQAARLQAPWMEEEVVFAGRVVPFGDGIASRMRDISSERAAQQALDEAQARVRLALAAAPLAFIQTDRQLVIDWAAGSVGLLGSDPERLRGQPLALELESGDAERFRRAYARVLGGGSDQERLDVHLTRTESPPWVSLVIAPRDDRQGQINGLALAMIDISEHQRLLEQLAERERLLRTVVDNTSDAIWLKDLDGHFILANELVAKMAGRRPNEVIGQTSYDLFPYATASEGVRHDQAVIASGRPLALRQRLERDQETRYFETRRFPLFDRHGLIVGVGGIASDISDKQMAEERSRLQATAMQRAAVGIAVVRISDLCLVEANEAYCGLFGYPPGSMTGLDTRQLNAPRAGERAAGEAERERVLAELEAGRSARLRVHNRRRDGSLFFSEATIVAWSHPDYGDCWLVVQRDISEVLRLEQRLAAAEARLERLGAAP